MKIHQKSIYVAMVLAGLTLQAKEITLSPKEIATWQIKSAKLPMAQEVPLGHFLIEVKTPPTMQQTITLPFEAQVTALVSALYEKVHKGQKLAEVTGTEWIEVQKAAISDAIELTHHTHTYHRKKRLCKEQIIPQKECIAALAELKTDKIKVAASKALLRSYGASEEIIKDLFKRFKIHRTIPITAPTDGTVTVMNASLGKSTDPSSALFVIQKEGDLWIESDLPNDKTKLLKESEPVTLVIEGKAYPSVVAQIAPILNPQNQTRHVRFLLKKGSELLAGLRSDARIVLKADSYKVPKKSVIKFDGKYVVFIDKGGVYRALPVEIVGEDRGYYYIKPTQELKNPVVLTAVAILKNLSGEDDE